MRWDSIQKVERPETLEAAYALGQRPEAQYFAGGSYLVARHDPSVNTLIDINELIEDRITDKGQTLHYGAGANLQAIITQSGLPESSPLFKSIKWSCSSKNIRNQRTLGGEIAARRINSEVYTFLSALNARLHIMADAPFETVLREWDGRGIITHVSLDSALMAQSAVERFALLPSAPAFVIVAGVRKGSQIDFTVGGKASDLSYLAVPAGELDNSIDALSEEAAERFWSDQNGSQDYKKALIRVGLKRVGDQL